jgi:hypothetical protein
MRFTIARVLGLFARPLSLFILVKSQASGSVTYALVLTCIGLGITFLNSEAYRAFYLDSSKEKFKTYISILPILIGSFVYLSIEVYLIPILVLIVICEKIYDEHQRRSIVTGKHQLWVLLCCFRYYLPAFVVAVAAYNEIDFLFIVLAWVGISYVGLYALKSNIYNLYIGEVVPGKYFIPNLANYFDQMLAGRMIYLILYSLICSLTIQMVRIVLVSYGDNIDELVLLYTMTFAIYSILDAVWFTRLRQKWLNEKTIESKTLLLLIILVLTIIVTTDWQWLLINRMYAFSPGVYDYYVTLILLVSLYILCSPLAQVNYWRLEVLQLFKLEITSVFCTLGLIALSSIFFDINLINFLVIFYIIRLTLNVLIYCSTAK